MVSYPPVRTKADFVRRYKAGEFGNHSPTWNTVGDFILTRWVDGLFHLRSRVAGGGTYYNLTASQLAIKWESMSDQSSWYCSAMAPHEHNLIQGELLVDAGYQLTFSDVVGLPMRDALAIGTKHASGIIAISLLKHYLCPNSWDWLQVLIERYPGHVIEFTTFSTYWGTLPRFNTVIWEVRNY